MEQSELLELFKVLTDKEIRRLGNYLTSTPIEQMRYRSEVLILYKLLCDYTQNNNADLIQKENAFQTVFPGKDFRTGHLERVMFELTQAIRHFLLYENYFREENELQQQLDLVSVLRSKGLLSRASQTLTQVFKMLDGIETKDTKYYGKLFDASVLAIWLASYNTKWKGDLHISQTIHSLDDYYFANKLDLINHYLLIGKSARLHADTQENSIGAIKNLPEYDLTKEPYLAISTKFYQILEHKNPEKHHFDELLALLKQSETRLANDAMQRLYSYLRNYCGLLIVHGHHELYPTLLQIYKDNLEKGYIFNDGKLPQGVYLNIANLAFRSGEKLWAWEFAQKYQNQILGSPEDCEEVFMLVSSLYYFHIKNMDEALRLLPSHSANLDRHLIIRRQEIMILYEMRSELLTYKLDAFKMYISRASKNTISEENREQNANFVNLLNQLCQVPPGDRERMQRIHQRIQQKSPVFEKEWLLDMSQFRRNM